MRRQEIPDTRRERYALFVIAAAALAGGTWLVLRIRSDLSAAHPWEFIGLAGTLVLLGYLGWLHHILINASYEVDGKRLLLQVGPRRVKVPLRSMIELQRWRQRWMWSDVAERDLGLMQIDLCPPTLLSRKEGTWVLVYAGAQGERQAVAFLPSTELVRTLRAWITEHRGASG